MLVNKQSVFKLCDFGISRQMRISQSIAVGAIQGTEAYLPVCIQNLLDIINYMLLYHSLS
jgi:hypothetical protein